jgi:PAS domain S-box-containing protein
VYDFFTRLFDTSDFPPRWQCGSWSAGHGWLHVLSDLGVWSAYVAIPVVLGVLAQRRRDVPFRPIFWLFGAFILACGTTHLMEAIIFWHPVYRLAGVIKLLTAVVSWATVVALVPVVPRALAMRSPEELEREVVARKQAEVALQRANADLERRVEERTRALTEAAAALRDERDLHRATLASVGASEQALLRERELLQTIIDRIPVMLTVYEPDARLLRLNPEFQHVTGWTQDEAAGVSLMEACYPDRDYRARVEKFMQSCRDGWMDIRMRTRDGRDVETSWANVRLSDRTQIGIGIDITQRKRSEERQRLLWRAASVLLTTDHPDAVLRDLFAEIGPHLGLDVLFNYTVDETGEALRLACCVGLPDEAARSIDRLPFGEAICGRVAVSRRPVAASRIQESDAPETRLVKSFGIRAYACNPLLVGDRLLGTLSFGSRSRDALDGGEVEFLQTLSRYVTAACERVRLVRELREADRRKDEFLAQLGHELRNPLAPLRNGVSILRLRAGGDADKFQLADMMERQVANLVRLVDDLLDVSRITRGKIELRKEPVDLAALALGAAETARPTLAERRHQLEVDLPPGLVFVDADPARIEQVVSNLLGNAGRYTPPGGRVHLTVAREGGEAVLRVRDTGIGIRADDLRAIWEPFRQAGRVEGRVSEGLGVGLTLVRRLVEMHGGTAAAASDGPGKGSEFTVRLPALTETAEPRQATPEASAPPAGGLKVLVVDDNDDGAASLATLLRLAGHDVRTAGDGARALAVARAFRPEVVLLDIALPGELDGYEVARRLRQEPGLEGVLLIALTGLGAPEDVARASTAGFDHHLAKPADPDLLRRRLREWQAGRR